jgi:hypothetical protein
MLRVQCLRLWFALSNPPVEEALYDSRTMLASLVIDLGHEPVPEETIAMRFRDLIGANQRAGPGQDRQPAVRDGGADQYLSSPTFTVGNRPSAVGKGDAWVSVSRLRHRADQVATRRNSPMAATATSSVVRTFARPASPAWVPCRGPNASGSKRVRRPSVDRAATEGPGRSAPQAPGRG